MRRTQRVETIQHVIWPLFRLRICTPRLEIRLPTDEECAALAELAAAGIHDPGEMPFAVPWTDVASPELERRALQWWWKALAGWSPEQWRFTGAVFVDGSPVGVQDLGGKDFATLRTVTTGSWLGRRYQGCGLGKEMRAAILHLAFAGLGATEARSGAWADNTRSLTVSRALGYTDNGEHRGLRRGQPERHIDLRLDRATWQSHRRDDIVIEGLAPCSHMFGAADQV